MIIDLKFLNSAQSEKIGNDEWLIIIDPAISGKQNMDRDRALLEWAYSDDKAKPVLRFFMWNPPAISIGFMQPMKQIDDAKCRENGIDIVRRPTGGKAIYHHTEFTYSVTLPPKHPMASLSVLETYNELSRALAFGLRNLEIPAKLAKGSAKIGGANPSCFSSASRYELMVDGKKLVGSAQRRKHRAVLQQGSIITGPQYLKLADFLTEYSETVREELENHSTYIESILGEIPDYNDFVEAMVEGFKRAFG
ncbi:lipoate--protein ligase family protein [bacterium]|nr:lipoate--protein ligase family protein [bacterium]